MEIIKDEKDFKLTIPREPKLLRIIEGWEYIPYGFKNMIVCWQFLSYLKVNNLKYNIDFINWTLRIKKTLKP